MVCTKQVNPMPSQSTEALDPFHGLLRRCNFIHRARDEQSRVRLRERGRGDIVPLERGFELFKINAQPKHSTRGVDGGGDGGLVPKRERQVSRCCTFSVTGNSPVIHVDVPHRTQDMDVGLVLLRHRILDVDKTLQRALNIGFVREGLGDHHDEATLDQFIGPQIVAVEGFTGITDKNEP